MAGSIIRKFTKWIFLGLNIICCLTFLSGSLTLLISPKEWPPVGFLALGLPYTAICLLFFAIFWLIAKPYLAILPFLTLLIGWKQLAVIAAWHPAKTFRERKEPAALRILSWNVRGMYGISNSSYTQERNRTEIASLINKLDADIVCLQEFMGSEDSHNIDLFTKKYPYHFYSADYANKSGDYVLGTILFSKHRILQTQKFKYEGPNAESLIYADIIKAGDTLRVFTTHLQSFEFNKEDYANIQKIKQTDEEALEASESIYSKMKRAFLKRSAQASLVKGELDKAPYPSVICGDFNDVPNSYTYFHIRGERKDAFLEAAFGLGRSYNALAPTLRIDYILPDNYFDVKQFEMVDEGLSDHHLLLTDLSLKK